MKTKMVIRVEWIGGKKIMSPLEPDGKYESFQRKLFRQEEVFATPQNCYELRGIKPRVMNTKLLFWSQTS